MDTEIRLRSVVSKTVVVCLALAVVPWLTGGQEPLGMMISGFALLLGALFIWRQPESRRLAVGPMVWLYGLFIGLGALSILWSASRYSSWVWVIQWVLAGLVFCLTYAVAGEARVRQWLLRAYLVSAALFSVVGLWFYFTGTYSRLTGTFYWANPAAAYLLPAIMLALDGARRARKRSRKQYGWSVTAIGFFAVFLLADSRGTSLALIGTLFLYLLVVSTKKIFWIHFVFIMGLGYLASFGLTSLSKLVPHDGAARTAPGSRFAEIAKGESTSGSDRIYYLQSALDMWFDYPFMGVGAGAYGDIHPQYQQGPSRAATNAHNEYLQVLAELGIVGAMMLAGMLLVLGLGSLRGLVDRPELVVVAVSLVGLLVHFGLDIDARYPALLGLVAMFFGLLYAQRERPPRKARWLWPAMAALVLVPIVALYESETWAQRGRVAQTDNRLEQAAEDYGYAQTPIVFNPDYLSAQGINLYADGLSAATGSKELEQQALAAARRAQTLDPHDSQHHQLEARVLLVQGDLKGAERAIRAALKLDGQNHPDYASDLATILLREHRTDEAVAVARAMVAQYPATVRARRLSDDTLPGKLADLDAFIGNVTLSQGKIDEAQAAATDGTTIDRSNLRIRALQHQIDEAKAGAVRAAAAAKTEAQAQAEAATAASADDIAQ